MPACDLSPKLRATALTLAVAGTALAGAWCTPRRPMRRPRRSMPRASGPLLRMVRRDCGSCHGMRLTGGLGPALTPQALVERETPTACSPPSTTAAPAPPCRRGRRCSPRPRCCAGSTPSCAPGCPTETGHEAPRRLCLMAAAGRPRDAVGVGRLCHAAGCGGRRSLRVAPRGAPTSDWVIQRPRGVVDTTHPAVLARITGLGDLSHASVVFARDGARAVFGRDGAVTQRQPADGAHRGACVAGRQLHRRRHRRTAGWWRRRTTSPAA